MPMETAEMLPASGGTTVTPKLVVPDNTSGDCGWIREPIGTFVNPTPLPVKAPEMLALFAPFVITLCGICVVASVPVILAAATELAVLATFAVEAFAAWMA